MLCPHCQVENPVGAKFCNACGGSLGRPCDACRHANPPTGRFCNHCGATLAMPDAVGPNELDRSPDRSVTNERAFAADTCEGPGSERKCVTVLFSGLAGYTEMAEKLDPEDVKGITRAIFGRFTEIVRKYDGFIEKYIGDAVLAVFGAVESLLRMKACDVFSVGIPEDGVGCHRRQSRLFNLNIRG